MPRDFTHGVLIGRFQPFHDGHLNSLRHALTRSDTLIIVVGSHRWARNTKNPFTSEERIEMISSCLSSEENGRVRFVPMRDYVYAENRWITEVQHAVEAIVGQNPAVSVALFGYEKDRSSAYLTQFPQWARVSTPHYGEINATDIRTRYFTPRAEVRDIPQPVADFLAKFKKTDEYTRLRDEHSHIIAYRQSWANSPFPPIFVTVDNVVVKSGHVLVVRRRGVPGKGLIALPGGFIDQHETCLDSAIRELKEETRIKVPPQELLKHVKANRVFDAPSRSMRGRTITHAFLIDLGKGDLPVVKGDDDAEKAWWMPLNEVVKNEENFFEDHFHIITSLVGGSL